MPCRRRTERSAAILLLRAREASFSIYLPLRETGILGPRRCILVARLSSSRARLQPVGGYHRSNESVSPGGGALYSLPADLASPRKRDFNPATSGCPIYDD